MCRVADMPITDLTFAAEIAGCRINESASVRPVLLDLLRHPDAIVREGAIYGIAHHLDDEVRMTLAMMSEYDPSGCIRECAREALEP